MDRPVKVLPWGEEVYMEIPLHGGKSPDKFYARHGKTSEGRDYIEFSKFGPKAGTEYETYSQKLRIYTPEQWKLIQDTVNNELAPSIGWDINKLTLDEEEAE